MCDLVTALTIGSTIMGAAGAIQQSQAAAAAAEYNAKVQRQNAELADRNARSQLEAGMAEEQKQKAYTTSLISKQQAAMAANGVDTSFGSPLDVMVDTAKQGAVDALTLRTNAYRQMDDTRNQAVAYRNQATLFDQQAASERDAGWWKAGGTVLSGGADAYKSWYKNNLGKIA